MMGRDTRIRDGAARYAAFFQELSPGTLHRLSEVVAPDVRFCDPFNEVSGADAMRGIFEHMFRELEAPRFVVNHVGLDGDTGLLHWTFTAETGKRPVFIEGMSRVRFDDAGRVVEHADYWDPAKTIYERLPLLGPVLALIRRRMARTQAAHPCSTPRP